MPSKRVRTLWHLHYTDWGDHGCPTDTRAYLEFLEEISSLRQHINSSSLSTSTSMLQMSSKSSKSASQKGRNPPVLVHCSAGVGRTGVAILCDILLYCVDHNVDVDIPKILGHLRQQRMLMVQTVAQYKFVHSVVIQYLKQSRLIWSPDLSSFPPFSWRVTIEVLRLKNSSSSVPFSLCSQSFSIMTQYWPSLYLNDFFSSLYLKPTDPTPSCWAM